MSRIQNILEKAERDGGVRRVRTMVEPAGNAAIAFEDPTPLPPPAMPLPPPSVVEVVNVRTAEPAPATPSRTLRATQLDPNLVAVLVPGAQAAEQYRALRTRVAHADHGSAVDVILVTSPGRGEGKSLTAANLALTMAQDFQTRICLVDADLRHSRLHSLFGVADTSGLADVLAGREALADALIGFEDQQITLLPAGKTPTRPAELLGSTAMRRIIETLRTQFDRVIIDAPAVGPLADVGILAPLVDGVVLVVQAGVTTKPAIQEAVATIGGDKFLGVVLNGGAA
jgi:capsular exopolysaccharide synthesis family protein